MHPRSVLAIDWFDYTRAWQKWRSQFQRTAPDVDVRFAQGDLEDLGDLPERSFDVFGSDAVFEHVRNLSRVLAQAFRVLRDGGLLYATFGPLWYAWGGDHISGSDRLDNGYNHLLLGPEDYRAYVSGAGDHSHSEHDGRTWIEHDLFSRLRPAEYLVRLHAAGLERLFVAAIVEPRAVECLKRNPAIARRLIPVYGLPSLVTTGITVVYAKSTGRRDG
jgi:SAM-dependent methyltransferase